MGYYFPPMMPFYQRFLGATTKWLMSKEGRRLIAKSIRHCRRHYGQQRAREYRDALMYVGCLYPILRDFSRVGL